MGTYADLLEEIQRNNNTVSIPGGRGVSTNPALPKPKLKP